jgi:Uma2 family endonuclease
MGGLLGRATVVSMEATLRLSRRASYADYLAAEQDSEHRHEFVDGVIVAMAGGSDEHNVIAGRLARLLGNRETGSCRYYTSGQRFWIASRARGQATTNPTVVIEVLSPSS